MGIGNIAKVPFFRLCHGRGGWCGFGIVHISLWVGHVMLLRETICSCVASEGYDVGIAAFFCYVIGCDGGVAV
jgi:hypothetical protein